MTSFSFSKNNSKTTCIDIQLHAPSNFLWIRNDLFSFWLWSFIKTFSAEKNVKEWKFTLISEWLLFNANRVGFSSKRAEKTFSWSLAIQSESHLRVEWPKFHSFSEWNISQSEASKIARYLLGWCNKMANTVWMSGEEKVDWMKK